jgi:hypothetical protein
MSRTAKRAALVSWACFAAVAPAPAAAQENLSFESIDPMSTAPTAWRLPTGDDARGYRFAADSNVAKDGARSLRITRSNGSDPARVTQRVALPSGAGASNRVRLSGYVRTSAEETAGATLWVRVNGPGGFLAADSSANAAEAPDADGWRRYIVEAPLPEDTREVAFGALLRGMGTVWFDALAVELLDARSLPEPSAAARRYVEAALDIMQEHSINRRRIDWPAFRAGTFEQARGAVTTADAQLALRFALRNLGDHHSYLVTQQTAVALSAAPVSNARTGRGSIAPRAQWLDGVGLLSLPGFAGGTPAAQVAFADRVQALIKELDESGVYGWILDLRLNSGGNLWPMLAGVGPLLGDGEAGASVYPDGREVAFWYEDGKAGFGDYVQLRVSGAPYRLAVPNAPIAVLTGPATASSAEVLAIAFRARGNSTIVGTPTRGLAAGNRTFPLADGAALVLTVAATRGRGGEVHHGAVEPDLVATAQNGAARDPVSGGGQAAIDAALTWLQQRRFVSHN